MYDPDEFLQISGIQHFSFCPRQWALIHIEQLWNENALTAEGKVLHSRVHDPDISDTRNGILTIRALPIKSYSLGFSGECDAVEFRQDKDGVTLRGRDGKWLPSPVEYKHGESKSNDCDRLQAAAQAMCLEEMFGCCIDNAFLFYFKTRKRETIAVTDELRASIVKMSEEMHRLFFSGYTPKVKPKKYCSNCSLAEICLPVLLKGRTPPNVEDYINDALKGDSDI